MEAKDLVLEVKEQRLGVLITNALEIKKFVEAKLAGYAPENYVGKIAEAKADRAELNKASKELNAKRLELEKSFMKPFDEFKAVIKDTTMAIDKASRALDEIVKVEETRERDEKMAEIGEIWDAHNFDLVPLVKILDQRWLNKTFKLSEVEKEIKKKIQQIKTDLETLSTLGDAEDLKAIYLDSLDLGMAIRHGEALKARREAIREYNGEPKIEEPVPEKTPEHPEKLEAPEDMETYTLRLTGTREALTELRKTIDHLGIRYEVVN